MSWRSVRFRIAALAAFVGVMWFVWLLDLAVPGAGSFAGPGIIPRTWPGLRGIAAAPFIHRDLDHLLANSVPILVLGAVILARGVAEFAMVVLVSGLVAGAGTWLFGAPNSQHIGASGILFGFFGYLVLRTAFDRRVSSALITIGVAMGYGSAFLYSLVPSGSVSWSGHFFGFLGGILAARIRSSAWTDVADRDRLSRASE